MSALRRCLLAAALLSPITLFGDAGVLIPSGADGPDRSILSLDEMDVAIDIDNGDARVSITQIFGSHRPGILEGEYLFSLPSRATVSRFAVWDGVTRIPGVILERRRAEEIYEQLKQQAIDPGLLQEGERGVEGAGEAARTSVFSARIVPIPGFGSKRLELTYHERVPVENLSASFALPLRPDAYNAQVAGLFTLRFSLRSAHALRDFRVNGQSYPLQVSERSASTIRGSFTGRNVTFAEDFSVEYTLAPDRADRLEVLTYRNPAPGAPALGAPPSAPRESPPGFFQASALIGTEVASAGSTPRSPRTIIALFDTSLSMQWDKLDRTFRALEAVLRSLRPVDRFNLVLFNSTTSTLAPAPISTDMAAIEQALTFVRAGRLRGGTDVQRALDVALAQSRLATGDRAIILFSDASATQGSIANARLASWYDNRRVAMPAAQRPRLYLFGVGDDTNVPLLRMLSREDGLMETVRSTEPIDFKLRAFVSKIGARPLEQLQLTVNPAARVDLVYPLDPVSFAGSVVSWVGRYTAPVTNATFTARGVRGGRAIEMRADVALPADAQTHDGLPRTWARARVDALLDKIARDGEDRESVDEIIRLAREYTFVTPYTSFLAAPRALLRPRVIKPGDPIIRVTTDESIVSVVAMFPFGLVKKLRFLDDEQVWQTRFLAPVDMADGTHEVRLILRDREGRTYREAKTFVIASKPPTLKVSVARSTVRRGDAIQLRADASATTRTIVARLYGAEPVDLRWDARERASVGMLTIPGDLSPGRYTVRVIAEDLAHNVATREVVLDVVP